MGLRQDEWWILQIFNGLYAHLAIFFFSKTQKFLKSAIFPYQSKGEFRAPLARKEVTPENSQVEDIFHAGPYQDTKENFRFWKSDSAVYKN